MSRPSRSARRLVGVAAVAAFALSGCGSSVVGVREAPSQTTTTAPITADSAQQIASRVLGKAQEARDAKGDAADTLRKEALTGTALAVATAAAKVEPADSSTATAPVERTEQPKVLAISRGTAWPRVILAQTTEPDGRLVLNLLTSPDAATPFRLSSSATMQSGASVAALDAVTAGSPLVAEDTKDPVAPAELLKAYAGALAYPKPTATKAVDTTDPFSTAVKANAAAQAKSFGKLATLTQVHTPQPDPVAIRLKDGGLLVFGLLSRTDAIKLASGGKSLTPSAEFQKLVKKKTLTKDAELRTYETVVLTVPPKGEASVVAVDQTLYSAKGA
ncbi:hypothetical protein [Knoellia koreensis]|uniref:DUF8094 domain-containing protein n=1 Tax=Knoellia koreensis TaxID=2730921 RepID=A0A849H951_9MICO|nr:hypothetical protein [Knoellia sp. DB2414S]NNM46266.1 hypothetical protein [Knoellia sp. DB2414S]